MRVLGSSRKISTDFLSPFTRPRLTAWGSACRSVDQSSKVTAGIFGQSQTFPVRERRSHSQFRAPPRTRRTHSVLASSNHTPRQLLGHSRETRDGGTSPHNGH